MSYPGSKNEPGKALLSLASWADRDERGSGNPARQPAGEASALDRQMNALLAGLAQPTRAPTYPASEPDRRPAHSGRSVADLLRGRSRHLAREPEMPAAMEPKAEEIAPPKMPEPARLNIIGVMKARKAAVNEQPESVVVSRETKTAPAPEKPRRGLVGTLAGLLKRKSSPRAQPAAEIASPRPLPPRAGTHVEVAPPAPADIVPERPAERLPVARGMPAPRGEASPQPMSQPAHPIAARAPVPYAPPPQPYAPPQAYAPPVMQPPMPPFHPAIQAPMQQPASAHFYWPQPAMPQPVMSQSWPYPPQAAWPMPSPAFQPDVAYAVPPQPAPAAAAPAVAAQPAATMPATDAESDHAARVQPDPLTAEIDAVRDQLRSFGETLRALHRTRESRRIG